MRNFSVKDALTLFILGIPASLAFFAWVLWITLGAKELRLPTSVLRIEAQAGTDTDVALRFIWRLPPAHRRMVLREGLAVAFARAVVLRELGSGRNP